MRWLIGLNLAVVAAVSASNAVAMSQEPPYEATIKNSSSVVHSAPSKRAYATDVLDRGTRVEVYRHDPEGWCAIRPPSTSFSLVPGDAVELTGEAMIGRITRDGVKAWVGTRISHRGDALWQVKLAQGELVEILEISGKSPEGRTDQWMLIAPPAGEFRWVHEADLARDPSPGNISFPDAPRQDAWPAASSAGTTGEPTVINPVTGAPPRELPVGTVENAIADATTAGSVGVIAAGADSGDGFVQRSGSGGVSTGAETAVEAAAPRGPEIDPAQDAAQRLRLAEQTLSGLLLGDASASEEYLRQLLVSLDAAETSPELRSEIQRLQDRFARFQELALKQKAVARLAKSQPNLLSDTTQSRPLSDGSLPADFNPADFQGDSRQFVAQGRLNRLVRAGGLTASGYAIQGPNGSIQAMVVAAPGVNLERFLKENVGIQGSQTPHPRLKIPVVLAERVINLDRR